MKKKWKSQKHSLDVKWASIHGLVIIMEAISTWKQEVSCQLHKDTEKHPDPHLLTYKKIKG